MSEKLTIKITQPIPLNAAFGLVVGSTWQVEEEVKAHNRGARGYWVIGRNGERAKVLPYECEVIRGTEVH